MKSAITICLVPEAKSGPFVFHGDLEQGCRKAAELGFDAVEVFTPSGSSPLLSPLRSLLQTYSLSLAAVGTGAGWLCHQWSLASADHETRSHALQFIESIIDFAGELGAPAIVGSMQGRVLPGQDRGECLRWLEEGLATLAERAKHWNQPLFYEPLNRYETNFFNRQVDAMHWLDDAKVDNVLLLADLFHMNIEESDVAGSLREIRNRLGHIHFADSNRCAIGMGHTQMDPIMHVLKEIEYRGYLSAEVLPFPNSLEAARQTMDSFRHCVS